MEVVELVLKVILLILGGIIFFHGIFTENTNSLICGGFYLTWVNQ